MCGERGEKIRKKEDLQETHTAPSSFLDRWLRPRPHRGREVHISGGKEVPGRKSLFSMHGKRVLHPVGFFLFVCLFYLLNVADEASHRSLLGKGLENSCWI